MITFKELLSGHIINDLPILHQHNLEDLLVKMNKIRDAYGKPMIPTSGYRSLQDQMRINPKCPKSGHMRGECVDIQDSNDELREFILQNKQLIVDLGLYLEDFRYCKGWIHFSIKPPASGNRVFVPYAGPTPHPELWDGVWL